MKQLKKHRVLWIAIAGATAGMLLAGGILACSMSNLMGERDFTATADSAANTDALPLDASASADAAIAVSTPVPLSAATLEQIDAFNQQRRSTRIPNLGVSAYAASGWEQYTPATLTTTLPHAIAEAADYISDLFDVQLSFVTYSAAILQDADAASATQSGEGYAYFSSGTEATADASAAPAESDAVTAAEASPDPAADGAQLYIVFSETDELAKEGKTIHFAFYRDSSGYRPPLVQLSFNEGEFLCTLRLDDLSLVNLDRALTPTGDGKQLSKNADAVAALLGGEVDELIVLADNELGDLKSEVCGLTLKNGDCAAFTAINGELCALSVLYPDRATLWELPSFGADIRATEPYVQHACAAADFIEGAPERGDMTRDAAELLYRKFLRAAAGATSDTGSLRQYKLTFYLDQSGARENYWHIEGEEMTMDIAARSGAIITCVCSDLCNRRAGPDLSKLSYTDMGGTEYAAYVQKLGEVAFGEDRVASVDVSSVTDGHDCVMRLLLDNDAEYDLYFTDGLLTKMLYYFNKAYRDTAEGWPADNLLVNTLTGETFYPEP